MRRYPEHLLPIAGQSSPEICGSNFALFCELREAVLVDYCYNTARAYWGDLDDLSRWASSEGKDILTLTERDFTLYAAQLRLRAYSESTIRRRGTAMRLLMREIEARALLPTQGPMDAPS